MFPPHLKPIWAGELHEQETDGVGVVCLLVTLIINRVAGVFGMVWVVVLMPFVVALYLRVHNWLADHIRVERDTWRQRERIWIGRTVLLREDIRNSNEPEGLQVYVRAGTVGKIVALNRDEHAPFQVMFPGFAHKVPVRLEKLDPDSSSKRKRTYHTA